jgi:hypothetical protein
MNISTKKNGKKVMTLDIESKKNEKLNQKASEKASEKLLCDICNDYIRRDYLSRHNKTQKHIKNLNKIEENKIEENKIEENKIDYDDRCNGCGRHDDFCRCGHFNNFGLGY